MLVIVSLSVFDINDINNYFKKLLFNVAETFACSDEDSRSNQPMALAETLCFNICANISTIRPKKGDADEIFFRFQYQILQCTTRQFPKVTRKVFQIKHAAKLD